MKKPSYSLSSRLMLVTHLTQESPAQPGATRRNGNPCEEGSGAPFIWKASRVSGCRAFSSATVRTKSGTLPMGTSAPLNRTWVAPDFTPARFRTDRKSTRLNSSHLGISYAVFCLKKKKTHTVQLTSVRRTPCTHSRHYCRLSR